MKQYKIKGKIYNTLNEIAEAFKVPVYKVQYWMRTKRTKCGETILVISAPRGEGWTR